MAASSLSAFSSLSLHPSPRRFSLLTPLPTSTISLSPTTTPSSLYFRLSLSTTKFNCTLNDSNVPKVEVEDGEEEDPEDEIDPGTKIPYKYMAPRVDIDPLTSTEDEISAAYERLYGPAYSGVSVLGNDVYVMNKKKERAENERKERVRDGFDEQVVQVRRVTKVTKGGKNMNFRAIVVVGNKQGKVGVGKGKAAEISTAVQKAAYDARRNIIDVPLTKFGTLPHRANGKFGGAEVMLRPACPGTGVVAGGAVRVVLQLAGLQNALGKQLRSNNVLNNARATVYAILKMSSFREVSAYRGIPIQEMWK